MKPHFKNIEQALAKDRPTDKVIKILNNKFAIVQSAYTNGTFDEPKLCGLDVDTVYFFGYLDKDGSSKFLKNRAKEVVAMPNNQTTLVGYKHLPYMVVKNQNNKHYKKAFRKILKLDF